MPRAFSSVNIDESLKKIPVGEFRAREDLIRQLENCVRERNEVIDKLETNLKVAEMALTSANNKIHSVRESEAHPVNSEVVIRLAHQISKNYSVSAPLYWQQGMSLFITQKELEKLPAQGSFQVTGVPGASDGMRRKGE
ncbi:unnamed protein product [Heligmosomoides polygyrus]|uniref:Mediator of RNA polymerase II transcription subunit 4 n=1 Tax=Heligmosomoides polygyrus TaxID=6339 RepID=A0A3P8BAS7_HELPZ|nr:unnamed protein product [Heligmosomoides polygyrus]